MPGTYPTAARTAARRRAAAFATWAADERRKTRRRDEFAQTVERMTNRQRSKWAQAGYPGLRGQDIEPLRAFLPAEAETPARPARRRKAA